MGILRARGCGLWRTLHYSVLLLAEVNGQLVALDQKAFEVTTDGSASPNPNPTPQVTAVPTTSPGGLALLALVVALAAGATRKKNHRRANVAAAARSSQEDAQ